MRWIGISVTVLTLAACATAIRGTTDVVSIQSTPVGAQVNIGGKSCITPCQAELARKQTHIITISHPGCKDSVTAVAPTITGSVWLFSGVPDYESGAAYDLHPNPVFVTLACN